MIQFDMNMKGIVESEMTMEEMIKNGWVEGSSPYTNYLDKYNYRVMHDYDNRWLIKDKNKGYETIDIITTSKLRGYLLRIEREQKINQIDD